MNYALVYSFLISLAGTIYNAKGRNDFWLAVFALICIGSAALLALAFSDATHKAGRCSRCGHSNSPKRKWWA